MSAETRPDRLPAVIVILYELLIAVTLCGMAWWPDLMPWPMRILLTVAAGIAVLAAFAVAREEWKWGTGPI